MAKCNLNGIGGETVKLYFNLVYSLYAMRSVLAH